VSNIDLVRKGMDAILVSRDAAEVRKYFAEDFIQHNPWSDDGMEHLLVLTEAGFGYEISRWVDDQDSQIVAYHGYYTAPNPLGDDPLVCVDMWRIANGLIQEHWDILMVTPEAEKEALLAGGAESSASQGRHVAEMKRQARAFLEGPVAGGDVDGIDRFVAADAVTHLKSGETNYGEMIKSYLRAGNRLSTDVKRVLASGDLAFVHAHARFNDEEKALVDIFRFERGGKIVESWSASQDIVPPEEAANSHPHF